MRTLLLSLALLTGATAAQAQSAAGGGSRFGFKVGVVAATLAGDDKDFQGDVQNRFGFLAGLTTTKALGVGSLFELHPELLYSQRGYQIDDVSKTTFHNIDLPLLARVNAEGLVFEAGPQVGYLFARKTKFEDAATPDITARGSSTSCCSATSSAWATSWPAAPMSASATTAASPASMTAMPRSPGAIRFATRCFNSTWASTSPGATKPQPCP
ncbi:PorT family protein (plasmid) [Hymenobacter qilianensis]|uniref:PorT family protein n=1 Tax=Hymenobacter qilianensis TaxID=1385715 RepID=A0A7H0H185_9BACT|nr:porin family protein [Hymenobacter qilianensis]QNP54301.1 PorT family protein [Hymenobacter qilianensis]